MLPFRKILFPVDFSEACKAVVPYVLDAVSHHDAELTLLHAYGGGSLSYVDLPSADPNWTKEIRAHETRRMADFATEAFPGTHLEQVLEEGDAPAVIEAALKSRGADLIMMPTHGLGPLRRMLLGSVTAKVLHDATTPVWTGTGAALTGHTPDIPYQSVLCAIDLEEEEAKAVLVAANALARSYGASLSILHVVDTPRASYEFDFTPLRKEVMDAADYRLREMKTSLGIDAPHQVVDAGITEGVRRAAGRESADLIVTGRGHSLGAVSRIWSHLYPLVREAPCPVLSI